MAHRWIDGARSRHDSTPAPHDPCNRPMSKPSGPLHCKSSHQTVTSLFHVHLTIEVANHGAVHCPLSKADAPKITPTRDLVPTTVTSYQPISIKHARPDSHSSNYRANTQLCSTEGEVKSFDSSTSSLSLSLLSRSPSLTHILNIPTTAELLLMADVNWCTFCDKQIMSYSNSLYCSDKCMHEDMQQHCTIPSMKMALPSYSRSILSSSPSSVSSVSSLSTTSSSGESPELHAPDSKMDSWEEGITPPWDDGMDNLIDSYLL